MNGVQSGSEMSADRNTGGFARSPRRASYDVVIVGGAIMGSASAWFLAQNPDFDGSILVVERDPGYGQSSTAHTNSCMRQQFSTALNIRISQFAADFVKNLRDYMGDERVPALDIQNYGYMYLADNDDFAALLQANQKIQLEAGTATEILSPDEIAARYPFYNLEDICLGSINLRDEGYWDGGTVFDWLRRSALKIQVNRLRGSTGSVIPAIAAVRAARGPLALTSVPQDTVSPELRVTWVTRPLAWPISITSFEIYSAPFSRAERRSQSKTVPPSQ